MFLLVFIVSWIAYKCSITHFLSFSNFVLHFSEHLGRNIVYLLLFWWFVTHSFGLEHSFPTAISQNMSCPKALLLFLFYFGIQLPIFNTDTSVSIFYSLNWSKVAFLASSNALSVPNTMFLHIYTIWARLKQNK